MYPGEPDVDWDDGNDKEPDPATVAFLDQETEAFNNESDQFESIFGFKHFCECASDYSSGNLVEVTECFGKLCMEALEACREIKRQRDIALALLEELAKEHDDGTGNAEGLSES